MGCGIYDYTQLFLDPVNGSNDNDGTTRALAWKTLSYALEEIRQKNKNFGGYIDLNVCNGVSSGIPFNEMTVQCKEFNNLQHVAITCDDSVTADIGFQIKLVDNLDITTDGPCMSWNLEDVSFNLCEIICDGVNNDISLYTGHNWIIIDSVIKFHSIKLRGIVVLEDTTLSFVDYSTLWPNRPFGNTYLYPNDDKPVTNWPSAGSALVFMRNATYVNIGLDNTTVVNSATQKIDYGFANEIDVDKSAGTLNCNKEITKQSVGGNDFTHGCTLSLTNIGYYGTEGTGAVKLPTLGSNQISILSTPVIRDNINGNIVTTRPNGNNMNNYVPILSVGSAVDKDTLYYVPIEKLLG